MVTTRAAVGRDKLIQAMGGVCVNAVCRCDDARVLQVNRIAGGTYKLLLASTGGRVMAETRRRAAAGDKSFRLLCATCLAILTAPCRRKAAPGSRNPAALSAAREELYQLIGHFCRRCPESHPDAMQVHHIGGGGQDDNPTYFVKGSDASGRIASAIGRTRRFTTRELTAPGSIVNLCANCHVIAHWEEKRGVFYRYKPIGSIRHGSRR